jgi:hypothetical protein
LEPSEPKNPTRKSYQLASRNQSKFHSKKSYCPSWVRTFNTCNIMPSYANSRAFGHQRNPSCGGSKPYGIPKGMSPSNSDPKDSLRPSSTWLKTNKESSKEACTSSTLLVYICGYGKRTLAQKKKISL